jgi:hypothetical protein
MLGAYCLNKHVHPFQNANSLLRIIQIMMGMNLVYGRVEKNRWFITYVLLAEVTIF